MTVEELQQALDAERASHVRDNEFHKRQSERQRLEFREALEKQRREYDATHVIGSRVRWLCMPGEKRKTVRLDDLRAMIAEIDERAATVGRGCDCEDAS